MATLQNSCNDSEGLLCRPQECLKINFWQANASSSFGPNIFFFIQKGRFRLRNELSRNWSILSHFLLCLGALIDYHLLRAQNIPQHSTPHVLPFVTVFGDSILYEIQL